MIEKSSIKISMNTSTIFHDVLVSSLGLDKYKIIMNGDISSKDIQDVFTHYYRVRRDKEAWLPKYYKLFELAKKDHYNFEQIIRTIYLWENKIEASFSSKMLATIDPNKPIWDSRVLKNLRLTLKGNTPEERLDNAVILYDEIEVLYTNYLETDEAKENIIEFDRILPDYKDISNIKKIDCLLWSMRNRVSPES